MKKIIFICISIFAFFSINVHASTESISDGIEWSIRWQGYTCTGVYNGEIKNNKPDGNGEFEGQIFIEETPGDIIVYDGKWINGMFDGKGVLENKTSHVKYVGDFSEGKLNGESCLPGFQCDTFSFTDVFSDSCCFSFNAKVPFV